MIKIGPRREIGNQLASRQKQSTLYGKRLQTSGRLDYFGIFAHTCKPETIRIPLQLSAKQGHVIQHFDVETAFLPSPIEEEVYLEQPQDFAKQKSDGGKLVCRLIKSIFCSKQDVDNWCWELEIIIRSQGFTRSRINHCLLARARVSGTKCHIFILVWVDKILASRSLIVISDFKIALEARFHMEDKRRPLWFFI